MSISRMGAMIEVDDEEWALVEDLFDPAGRRGAPARYDRRGMVGRHPVPGANRLPVALPAERHPPWEAVWQQWRRWRENGVWARALVRIAHLVRARAKRRNVEPTMVMIDAQTVRGGRAGPTFHNAGGPRRPDGRCQAQHPRRVSRAAARGPRRSGQAARREGGPRVPRRAPPRAAARPGCDRRPGLPGARGARRAPAPRSPQQAPPKGSTGFVPLAPLYKVEHAFAPLGRWRRLSRCYEGTESGARAWLEVASLAYLFARLRIEPT